MSKNLINSDWFDSRDRWRNHTHKCLYSPSATDHGKAAVSIYVALDFPVDGVYRGTTGYNGLRRQIASKVPNLRRRIYGLGGQVYGEILGSRVLAELTDTGLQVFATTESHPHINQVSINRTDKGGLSLSSHRLYPAGKIDSEMVARLPQAGHIGAIAGQISALEYIINNPEYQLK